MITKQNQKEISGHITKVNEILSEKKLKEEQERKRAAEQARLMQERFRKIQELKNDIQPEIKRMMIESRENCVYNSCNPEEIIMEIAHELGIRHSSYDALIKKLSNDPYGDTMTIIAMELLVNHIVPLHTIFKRYILKDTFKVMSHRLIRQYILKRFILTDSEFVAKALKVEAKMKQIKIQ